MKILKIKKQTLTIILLMSLFLTFFNNASYSQVKPSKVFLERELKKQFDKFSSYGGVSLTEVYHTIDELKNNVRYNDFSGELQVLATKKVDSYDAFTDYLDKIIKITWFRADLTEKMLDKVLIDLLDNKYKENKSDKLKLHSLFTEMYDKIKSNKEILKLHNKNKNNSQIITLGRYGGTALRTLHYLKDDIKPNSNPPDYITEILNDEKFSLKNSYSSTLEKKREETELEKIFIEYTNSHINKTIDFDGLYIELAKGKYVEVEASETYYCYYTYGNAYYFRAPQRLFTLENKVPLINKINKIVLKGPKFNSTSMANSGIYKMDRKFLGDMVYHFVCDEKKLSKLMYHAYVRQGAEKGEFIEILTKKKTLGKNHYELYFTKSLESGLYAFVIDATLFMFKIK